ncbi:hypothetical protein C8039_11740 [Halogeometricum sp. wsp3]|nr:hypothetical protein C8039_11740 [Halogeometricum sp. wsp3]
MVTVELYSSDRRFYRTRNLERTVILLSCRLSRLQGNRRACPNPVFRPYTACPLSTIFRERGVVRFDYLDCIVAVNQDGVVTVSSEGDCG